MRVNDFDYNLPVELIAQYPPEKRDHSRLMVLDRSTESISHDIFYNIVDYIDSGDLLIINNTRVIPARIFGIKESGAKIEIFLLNKIDDTYWQCLIRPQKRIKPGNIIILKDKSIVRVIKREVDGKWIIETPVGFNEILDSIGNTPLPPYINRSKEITTLQQDKERYQTIYAKSSGAVAAPTAGLHFTADVMDKLKEKNIEIAEITLHVGLGTFKPVQCEFVKDHIMHEEYYSISNEAAQKINHTKKKGNKVIAVGTTSIRTLETVAGLNNGMIVPCSGWSGIFITPGYDFKIVDSCITNFHIPKSTLVMLISAFTGKEFLFSAYNEAIKNNYRFYSYGDCMFVR